MKWSRVLRARRLRGARQRLQQLRLLSRRAQEDARLVHPFLLTAGRTASTAVADWPNEAGKLAHRNLRAIRAREGNLPASAAETSFRLMVPIAHSLAGH